MKSRRGENQPRPDSTAVRTGPSLRGLTTAAPAAAAPPPSRFRRDALLAAILVGVTFLAYYRVLSYGFIFYDDTDYVTANEVLQKGLSPGAIAWALCATVSANWHPLTMLSLQLDFELFGLNPWGYHLHNLLLHLVNVVLLFFVLRRLTAAVWRSFIVAALFALHPLHVESVAWVSERKDVLSTLFGLLALWAYLAYVARPGVWRMTAVAALLALSLLAKAMWVTFPCVLLLLDFWPLARWHSDRKWLLLAEKIPLFAIVALFCMTTVDAQRAALFSFEGLPFSMRAANAADSYVAYLRQTFVPNDLAIFYPHPKERAEGWPAALLLLGVSAAAVWLARRLPYLFVGWFWYLGMLVPVIGLVQVGGQARADRYTYVPLVGIFIALTWGLGDLAARAGRPRLGFAAAALLAVLCGVLTWFQLDHWRNDVTLWQQASRVSPDDDRSLGNLGAALLDKGDLDGALEQFNRLAQLEPGNAENHSNRGTALRRLGKLDEAEAAYKLALELDPSLRRLDSGPEIGLRNVARERQRRENAQK